MLQNGYSMIQLEDPVDTSKSLLIHHYFLPLFYKEDLFPTLEIKRSLALGIGQTPKKQTRSRTAGTQLRSRNTVTSRYT